MEQTLVTARNWARAIAAVAQIWKKQGSFPSNWGRIARFVAAGGGSWIVGGRGPVAAASTGRVRLEGWNRLEIQPAVRER